MLKLWPLTAAANQQGPGLCAALCVCVCVLSDDRDTDRGGMVDLFVVAEAIAYKHKDLGRQLAGKRSSCFSTCTLQRRQRKHFNFNAMNGFLVDGAVIWGVLDKLLLLQ